MDFTTRILLDKGFWMPLGGGGTFCHYKALPYFPQLKDASHAEMRVTDVEHPGSRKFKIVEKPHEKFYVTIWTPTRRWYWPFTGRTHYTPGAGRFAISRNLDFNKPYWVSMTTY